ncbi:MAG: hypothetical protein K6357_05800 [Elusimicrobiota bacterium]
MKLLFLIFSYLVFAEDYSIQPYAVISDTKMINEGSTLVKSKKYDVLWTLNDSGDTARIFAIDLSGKVIKPQWLKKYNGIKIVDAANIDWEAMTYDNEGNLIIADIGNNYNYRTDLALYKIAEPNPFYADQSGIISKYLIRYPDQKGFPPSPNDMNFDAEAIFYYKGKLYLIAKTRSTTIATIYRFDSLKPWDINIPQVSAKFDFKSMVTDAAVSEDEKHIAVLTYNYVWLFETEDKENPFSGRFYNKEISLGQCEGISFLNNNEIVISNEEGYLFKIKISDLKK